MQQEQKSDSVDEFGRFLISSLREMDEEQRDICEALCFDAIRQGKKRVLSSDHRIVKIAKLGELNYQITTIIDCFCL